MSEGNIINTKKVAVVVELAIIIPPIAVVVMSAIVVPPVAIVVESAAVVCADHQSAAPHRCSAAFQLKAQQTHRNKHTTVLTSKMKCNDREKQIAKMVLEKRNHQNLGLGAKQ